MTRFPRLALPLALATSIGLPALTAARAFGQAPPPGTGPQPGGPIGGEEEPKGEGVAEKAPKEAGQLPTVPTLPPWPGEKKKQFQLLEMGGYFRLRTDWFDNFHLGFHDLGSGTAFPEGLACSRNVPAMVNGANVAAQCTGSVGSGNMRLRLEPVFNLSENVSVHTQIDVFDDLVLGSTPQGTYYDGTPAPASTPVNGFSTGQAPPQAGRNWVSDSIVVKRAWGEVTLPIGKLSFGRMPAHWGMGVFANSGGYDPVHGTYMTDGDYGDNVDRVFFGAKIPGTKLKAGLGMDWAATGPTSAQTTIGKNRDGQPWDLEDADDLREWVFVLAKMDSPDEWKEKVDSGELALNYGAYMLYRKQELDVNPISSTTPDVNLVPRGLTEYIPDLYFHLGYKKINVEVEGVVTAGTINNLGDVNKGGMGVAAVTNEDVLEIGGVAKFNELFVDDTLNLGVEVGFASGDSYDNVLQGNSHNSGIPIVPADGNDHNITAFRFNPDYHVDLILFRQLIGTVTNATYVKPNLTYDLTDRIKFKAAGVFSFANIPVATPGNGSMYGVELDGDLGYANVDEGFYAGISYGVLFPLGALDHPSELGYMAGEAGSASTAQTIQTRLVIKF